MIEELKSHLKTVESYAADTLEDVESFRIKYLGKKGILNHYFAEFKSVPNEEKKAYGQAINALKQASLKKVEDLKKELSKVQDEKGIYGDLTRPAEPIEIGARHPISIVKIKLLKCFLILVSMFLKARK